MKLNSIKHQRTVNLPACLWSRFNKTNSRY